MGVVYEAEQISLGRRVALKVLPFAAALDSKTVAALRERGPCGRPPPSPAYRAGLRGRLRGGVHYYAMQFIEGQTLAAVIAELRQQGGLDKGDPSQVLLPVAQDLVSGRLAPVKRAKGEGPPTTPYVPCEPRRQWLATRGPGLVCRRSVPSTAAFRRRTVASLGIQAVEAVDMRIAWGRASRHQAGEFVAGCARQPVDSKLVWPIVKARPG